VLGPIGPANSFACACVIVVKTRIHLSGVIETENTPLSEVANRTWILALPAIIVSDFSVVPLSFSKNSFVFASAAPTASASSGVIDILS